MPKNQVSNFNRETFSSFAVGTVIGIVTTLGALFIFAIIMTAVDISTSVLPVFATISLIIGSFFGAMYTVGKIKKKGFLNGIIVGAVVFLVIFIISFFVSREGLTLTTVFHLVCCLLSGGISGIIRVNRETKKRYLKH